MKWNSLEIKLYLFGNLFSKKNKFRHEKNGRLEKSACMYNVLFILHFINKFNSFWYEAVYADRWTHFPKTVFRCWAVRCLKRNSNLFEKYLNQREDYSLIL